MRVPCTIHSTQRLLRTKAPPLLSSIPREQSFPHIFRFNDRTNSSREGGTTVKYELQVITWERKNVSVKVSLKCCHQCYKTEKHLLPSTCFFFSCHSLCILPHNNVKLCGKTEDFIFLNPQATNVIYIYMEHEFLMFLDHTQRRSTIGRTPLDE